MQHALTTSIKDSLVSCVKLLLLALFSTTCGGNFIKTSETKIMAFIWFPLIVLSTERLSIMGAISSSMGSLASESNAFKYSWSYIHYVKRTLITIIIDCVDTIRVAHFYHKFSQIIIFHGCIREELRVKYMEGSKWTGHTFNIHAHLYTLTQGMLTIMGAR